MSGIRGTDVTPEINLEERDWIDIRSIKLRDEVENYETMKVREMNRKDACACFSSRSFQFEPFFPAILP